MEKISALIDKLQELKNSNAGLQAISIYVQLLQAEIHKARSDEKEKENGHSPSHIAVIMPSAPLPTSQPVTIVSNETITPAHTTTTATLVMPQQPPATRPVVATPPPKEAAPVAEVTPTPVVDTPPVEKAVPAMITLFPQPHHPAAEHPVPTSHERYLPESKDNAVQPVYSTADLQPASNDVHKELKELNQRVAQQSTSLNDRLKQDQPGLAERLNDLPVKDLRHAIGINDKFRFIQELFRGDVDTYERSVKTINEFQTLQEAEYWIERELKIRQGWKDDDGIVQQFYSLVRKRFS